METQQVAAEINALKDRIRDHDGIIESLTNVKHRKEEEVVHLQKLIAHLKNRRMENILISKDRIVRQETSLRSIDEKQSRLASQKDDLLRVERAFQTRSSAGQPQPTNTPRPADPVAQERNAPQSMANQPPATNIEPLLQGTARFPTLDSYLSPKSSRLNQPRQSPETPVSFSQRHASFHRFEHNASLKLRANMMLDSIDKDLKRLYK